MREHGINYSTFMSESIKADFEVIPKILSEMAIHEPAVFAALVDSAKGTLSHTRSQVA